MMMNEVRGMETCKVCGRDFPLIHEEHYVVRDTEKTGVIPTIQGQEESKLFDAFDCPHCGCQNIVQDRKRKLEEEFEFDLTEDHDDCDGCKYELNGIYQLPCCYCKQAYQDRFERGEK